ncbi:exported hypothetical protein [Candidatus Terasakiella magnetica]|uniref:Uncharacterized protein n=1 Tax=Candidatus Terasakiella magnetica TaxID=1867952 RepID=A0A1C3RLD7_9PROT|nr:hypothetical protein [Candidatus Terasakiella magnetica]SCA58096.1 exported hypothetical protein [Candidatus Terasakiella magnetica]
MKKMLIGLLLVLTIAAGIQFTLNKYTASGKKDASATNKATQAVALKILFDNYAGVYDKITLQYASEEVTLDKTVNTGFYHADSEIIDEAVPNVWTTKDDQKIIIKYNVIIKGLGDDAKAEKVAVLPNTSLALCQAYNKEIIEADADATPPTGVGAIADWESGATSSDITAGTAIDASSSTTMENKLSQCIKVGTSYVTYMVLEYS